LRYSAGGSSGRQSHADQLDGDTRRVEAAKSERSERRHTGISHTRARSEGGGQFAAAARSIA